VRGGPHRAEPLSAGLVEGFVDTPRQCRARRHRLPRRLLGVLTAFRGAAVSALLVLVVVGGLHPTGTSASGGSATGTDAYQRVVERAASEHRCSGDSIGSGGTTASALIRNARGRLRQVPFETGWDVYNGKRPGTLVAVCFDDGLGAGLVRTSS
jgi:hypothetical protein